MNKLTADKEKKLTNILLDVRREVLQNGNHVEHNDLTNDIWLNVESLHESQILGNKQAATFHSTKAIALLIQYQLKFL